MTGLADKIRDVKPTKDEPFPDVGRFVRQVRESKRLSQKEVAAIAKMRNERISRVELGTNARMEQYHKIALALGFRGGALEMFRSGGDVLTQQLLRSWARLNLEERKDVLKQAKRLIDGASERDAT